MSRIRSVVISETGLFLGLAAAVSAMGLAARLFPFPEAMRLSSGSALLFASSPTLLFLACALRAQKSGSELPRQLVFASLLGAFVAGPMSSFVIEPLSQVGPAQTMGLAAFSVDRLIRAFFVVAVIEELSKYIIVRYAFYPSPLLSDPLDGVFFSSATALGFAGFQIHALVSGPILPVAAVNESALLVLGHVSASALCGYGFAAAKFLPLKRRFRSLVLFSGIAAAAMCNGSFFTLATAIEHQGLDLSPWRRLFFAFGFASILFVVVSVLCHRVVTRHRSSPATMPSDAEPKEETA